VKKIVLIVVAVLVLAGGGFVFVKSRHKPPAPIVPPPEAAKQQPPAASTNTADKPQEPAQLSDGFVVSVLSVSKSNATEAIKMRLTNAGSTPLDVSPGKQFKLFGLTSKTERLPREVTENFAGTIPPNDKLEGSLYFDTLNDEESEVRFYPDLAQSTYLVVPLIPLPSDQQ